MAGEAEGDVVVPPTLQALLGARLDQLETAERSVLERGAIEGEIFHRGAVQALAPEETQVTPRLAALVRKELIRPDRPQLAGEDGFRFRHLLIRDAAYDALPKATRADLHERFASWLEEHGTELVELDEILGYHLEQACRYRAELGTPDDGILAAAARRRLTAAGHRAAPPAGLRRRRQPVRARRRARRRRPSSTSPSRPSSSTPCSGRARATTRSGAQIPSPSVPLRRAIVSASSAGGSRRACSASTSSRRARRRSWPRSSSRRCPCSRPPATTWPCTSPTPRSRRWRTCAGRWTQGWRHTSGPSPTLGRRATYRLRSWRLAPLCRFFGTTPVSELLAWLDENEPRAGRDHFLRAYRAGALAMLGRFDEARAILAEARAELAERGGGVLLANITAFESVWVELWAGDPAAAAEFGAAGFRLHEELGEQGFLSTAAGNLAQALYALDRLDEADAWAGRAAELGASDDAVTQMLWRQVRAKVLARRGEHAEAERLAREAVAIGEGTDVLNGQGDAYADLAEVLLLGGKAGEAAAALEQALDRYERKGNLVMARRTRDRLAAAAAQTSGAKRLGHRGFEPLQPLDD